MARQLQLAHTTPVPAVSGSEAHAMKLMEREPSKPVGRQVRRPHTHGLTPAETEVLVLLASGLTYRQIARRRGVLWRTVRNQMGVIMSKLGVANAFEAAHYAWRHGVVGIEEAWQTLISYGTEE